MFAAPMFATLLLVACVLFMLAAVASAQTLARPGLAGSNLNLEPWWQHAVFYQTGPDADYKAVSARLDGLQSLGIDALIVPAPQFSAPTHNTGDTAAPPDAALDAFDDLIHQASRSGIRVLLALPAPAHPAELPATAQFWLSRGVAGFHLVTAPGTSSQDAQSMAQALRKITGSAVGQRIVISDFQPNDLPTATPTPHQRTSQPLHRSARRTAPQSTGDALNAQLQIDSLLNSLRTPTAATIRPPLAQSLTVPNVVLDFSPSSPSLALAKAIATIQLITHSAALIDADSDITAALAQPAKPATAPATAKPDSLATWYRQLSALHRSNAALRYGNLTTLDFDDQNALAWVAQASSSASLTSVVVVCNLSASPIRLSLAAAIKGLNLRGSFLRTLLRSDDGMGPQDLNAVILPPYAVYIGELGR